MPLGTETWEGGTDEANITTGNSTASAIIDSGGGAIIKFDNAQDPFPGGTQSARLRCDTDNFPSKSANVGFSYTAIPNPYLKTYIRFNSLGRFFYDPGAGVSGSLQSAAFITFLGTGGARITVTIGTIPEKASAPGPETQGVIGALRTGSDWEFIKTDGTMTGPGNDDNDYTVARKVINPGVNHKVEIVVTSLSTYDIYIDDVKQNSVPLTPSGIGTGFNLTRISNLRRADDIWFGDTTVDTDAAYSPGSISGGNPF